MLWQNAILYFTTFLSGHESVHNFLPNFEESWIYVKAQIISCSILALRTKHETWKEDYRKRKEKEVKLEASATSISSRNIRYVF